MNKYFIFITIIILFIIGLNKISNIKYDEYIFEHENLLLIDLNKLNNNVTFTNLTFNRTHQVFYIERDTDLAIRCPIFSRKIRWQRDIFINNKPHHENIELYENKNRIFINKDQILLIRNLDLYDTGIYYCLDEEFNSIKIIIITLLEKLAHSHVITHLNESYYNNHFYFRTKIANKKSSELNYTNVESKLHFYQIWKKTYSCSDLANGFKNRIGECYTQWIDRNNDSLFRDYLIEWPCNSYINFNYLTDSFIEDTIGTLSFHNKINELKILNYLEYEVCPDRHQQIKTEEDEIVNFLHLFAFY
jgi:hypothetical protein